MKVEIRLGKVKCQSVVLVDGYRIKQGLLDFDVNVGNSSHDLPYVMLKVWPERLVITSEDGLHVVEKDLRAPRLGPGWKFTWRQFSRNTHKAMRELREIWREERAHARRW